MNNNNRIEYSDLTDNQVLAILRYELSRRTNHSNAPVGQDLILMDEVATRFASLIEQNDRLAEELEQNDRLAEEAADGQDSLRAGAMGDDDDVDENDLKRDWVLEMIQKETDLELASMDGETKPNFTSLDEFLAHMNAIADQLNIHGATGIHAHFAASAIRLAMERLKEIR